MAAMNSGSELELLDLTSTESKGVVWMQLIGTQLVPATDVFRVTSGNMVAAAVCVYRILKAALIICVWWEVTWYCLVLVTKLQ